jgi:uncharacterized sulfatase
MHQTGKLSPAQSRFWEVKPPEELYDLKADPFELHNLADSPHHQDILDRLRTAHRLHSVQTRDVQFLSEAEMHRRAKNSTALIWQIQDNSEATSIYEMAQNPQRYDIERIFAMAELAADYNFSALPILETGLRDDDPAVRYWAAMGILTRGERAFDATKSSVRVSLDDPNPSVRVVAANILAVHAEAGERQNAVNQLIELAKPDKYGVYVALEALNVLKNLDFVSDSTKEALLRNKTEDPNSFWRGANQYILRLLPNFVHDYVR